MRMNIETLAMKALNMNALKKKKEAFDLIKMALFKNLANFTCWHVYGILNRANKYDTFIWSYIHDAYLDTMMRQGKLISMH
jgi:peptide alpha-N-acetyltransferase